MLVFALAVAAAAAQPILPPGISAVQQARATVRIVSGARVTAERTPDDALIRDTRIRGEDGTQKTARLIEFP